MNQPYDALLVVSFGGPEGMGDVMPFLSNVLRGRNVPESRMREVAHHYELFGGVSPINGQNRRLISALERELEGEGPPRVEKLRAFYNHPGFVGPNVENLRAALGQLPEGARAAARVAFTAHSVPSAMAAGCDYERQLLETSRLVAEGAGAENWRLVFQSRSGPPTQPWLEPDICDHLRALKSEGARDVVVAPVGFVSDHMEVLYDLDTEARQLSEEIGVNMVRAATVGTHPEFVR